ncbi:hypothetical protein QYE76_027722 [Lolium multiflorum]|uniref:Gnk2-homologous domain-containing protein n=1 Tax=Lolium multiflorum TaxID=4521 RepID=A0AAD8QMX5_LOLMU|nr:hypothetical protein QYE76_027722 [Lolium multiflorum]
MVILLLLLLSGLTPFLAAADEFCDNLKVLAATLPENTSSSPVHFAAASFGQAPNVAYTLALCRGDILNDTACGECVASLFQIFLNVAPCYKAVSYYGDCIFVYSANDILAPSNNTGGTIPSRGFGRSFHPRPKLCPPGEISYKNSLRHHRSLGLLVPTPIRLERYQRSG